MPPNVKAHPQSATTPSSACSCDIRVERSAKTYIYSEHLSQRIEITDEVANRLESSPPPENIAPHYNKRREGKSGDQLTLVGAQLALRAAARTSRDGSAAVRRCGAGKGSGNAKRGEGRKGHFANVTWAGKRAHERKYDLFGEAVREEDFFVYSVPI